MARWVTNLVWLALLIWAGYRLAPQVGAWVGLGGPRGPAPSLAVDTRAGTRIDDADLEDRVVVVNFWATWCLPCRVEMPALQRLHEDYADRGLVVLGLATDGSQEAAVAAFLEEVAVTFPIGTASHGLRAAFGGIDRLPTTILIDRDGQVRHRVEGLMAPPALRSAVRRLLEGR